MEELTGELLEAKTDEELLNRLDAIQKQLAALADLLRRLPEIQAAVLLTMKEEQRKAAFMGIGPEDLWVIPPPDQR